MYVSDMTQGLDFDLGGHIRARVKSLPGVVWTPVAFLDLGPRTAIDKALQRLVTSSKLVVGHFA